MFSVLPDRSVLYYRPTMIDKRLPICSRAAVRKQTKEKLIILLHFQIFSYCSLYLFKQQFYSICFYSFPMFSFLSFVFTCTSTCAVGNLSIHLNFPPKKRDFLYPRFSVPETRFLFSTETKRKWSIYEVLSYPLHRYDLHSCVALNFVKPCR